MNNQLESRLKQIEIEDFVFLIFIILIFLAYYANTQEKNYFITGNKQSKQEYYYIQIIVFLVTVIISAYYLYESYKEANSLKYQAPSERKDYANLSFIGSFSALVAGLVFLYIAITDTEIDAEISL